MKNFWLKFILSTFVFISLANGADKKLVITVNKFVSHVALDAAENGLKKALEERGIVAPSKADLVYSNAQGSISNSVQIAKYHMSLSPDFMVAIATPAAQTGLKAKSDKEILAFVAVTDPKAANLVDQKNVIGVSDSPPIQKLIEVTRLVFPAVKKIGIVHNSGEVNSVKMAAEFTSLAEAQNISIKTVTITSSNDIKSAISKLVGEVEIIYLPQDNTVVSAIDNIVRLSREAKIPLIANDPTLVDKGVLLAFGADYYASGFQLGNMIADITEGKNLAEPIQKSNAIKLKINHDVAKELSIQIPDKVKEMER